MRLTAAQEADSAGDFLACHALAAQALMRSITSGDGLTQQFGPRAAIVQGQAFLLEAITPFAFSARQTACGFTGDLRSLAC